MILSNNKAFWFCKKLMILMVFILIPLILSAQNFKSSSQQDTSIYIPSNYSLGIILGYTGLFKDSALAEIIPEKHYIDGISFGFIFEFKFENTKASLQILSETHQLNLDFGGNNNDNVEMSSFNMIGIKAFTGIVNGIYVIPAVGILTGKQTQFISSLSLGYQLYDNKKSLSFFQIGYSYTDFKDIFFTIRIGSMYHL